MKKKIRQFKVEIRKTCKICGSPITEKRFRTYCSEKCRNTQNNRKAYIYQKEWSLKKRGEYAPNKKKCIICGKWYRQVGSHIVQRHGMTCREYRELYDLPVKRGILPQDLRELKSEQVKENGTYNNLKAGKKYLFVKNDKRAKIKSLFYKGQHAKVKLIPEEYI